MPEAERQFLQRLAKTVGRGHGARKLITQGIGDDCAVLRLPRNHEALVTTDFSLEGIHFRRDWHPAEAVGHRCLTRGLSDIASMGGEPLAAFLSLAMPADLPQRWADGFLRGLLKLAKRYGVTLAGGDTAQSPAGVLADITMLGSVPKGKAVLRSGARVGDDIYVTGLLGGPVAVLDFLRTVKREPLPPKLQWQLDVIRAASDLLDELKPPKNRAKRRDSNQGKGCVIQPPGTPRPSSYRRFVFPQPRIEVGRFLRERKLASAMIDVSDGLSVDLAHICEESGVGAWISEAAVPHTPDATLEQALHGGDEYELIFTVPAAKSARVPAEIDGVPVTYIGTIVKQKGIWLVDREMKSRRPLEAKGWQHFTE